MPEPVGRAIDELYHTFSGYPVRSVDGCAHCVEDADHAPLHAHPLRQLTANDLRRYAGKARTTWGDSRDFRHFLPRLCELLAVEDGLAEPEIALGKLDYAGWRTWPGQEQRGIEAYLHALWRSMLGDFPTRILAESDAATILCAIAQAEDDLGSYLVDWQEACATLVPALRHLASFIRANGTAVAGNARLGNHFWRDRPVQMRRCLEWLLAPATETLLEQGFFASAGQAVGQELSGAVALLRQMREGERAGGQR